MSAPTGRERCMHLAAGQIPQAEQRFKALATADPTATNLLMLADFYLATRKTAEAKATFEKAAVDPEGFIAGATEVGRTVSGEW